MHAMLYWLLWLMWQPLLLKLHQSWVHAMLHWHVLCLDLLDCGCCGMVPGRTTDVLTDIGA